MSKSENTMKYSNHKEGSIIIVVILTVAVLTIYMATIMQTNGFMMDIAHNRLKQYQYYHATKALLDYGIALSAEAFDMLTQQAKDANIERTSTLKPWPKDGFVYVGVFKVRIYADHINLVALLQEKGHNLYAMSCQLYKQDRGIFVDHWSHTTT